MEIEILGTESLGVRGLCCLVKTANQRVLIDPGVALGWQRAGLLPHPIQVAAGEDVRTAIVNNLATATDVVISHFHGDHMPLADANPYQLSTEAVAGLLRKPRLWMKSLNGDKPHIGERRERLLAALNTNVPPCNGGVHGSLAFSEAMPHGLADVPMGTVMMTRVEEGTEIFVHASDIQLLADEPVSQILDWSPTMLLLSGPAMYRELPRGELAKARARAKALADKIDICVIDHHLLRCREGVEWLDELRAETKGKIMCAADFMQKERRFLEARRAELYECFPVPRGWHESYAAGRADTSAFRNIRHTNHDRNPYQENGWR